MIFINYYIIIEPNERVNNCGGTRFVEPIVTELNFLLFPRIGLSSVFTTSPQLAS